VLELLKLVGIDVFSDGEFRRGSWSGDFADTVDGYVQGAPAVTVFNTSVGNAPRQRQATRVASSAPRPTRCTPVVPRRCMTWLAHDGSTVWLRVHACRQST
jgi:hypothetical protein